MKPLHVDGAELRRFHGQTLAQSIESVELLLRDLPSAHVPGDAYTLTSPGQTAQSGHARHVDILTDRLDVLRLALDDLARRVRQTGTTYRRAESASRQAVTDVEA